MLESLDNSNGVQYYGGNDPAKMGGRIRKGGSTGSGVSAKRSAAGQRSSVDKFGVQSGNVAKNQAVLKDKNSTPEQRAIAKRKITANTRVQREMASGKISANYRVTKGLEKYSG